MNPQRRGSSPPLFYFSKEGICMECPRCFGSDVSPVGGTHYVCNNKKCVNDDGSRTQFSLEIDEKVCFPYNQIFVSRSRNEFYKKPYLKLKNAGITVT